MEKNRLSSDFSIKGKARLRSVSANWRRVSELRKGKKNEQTTGKPE